MINIIIVLFTWWLIYTQVISWIRAPNSSAPTNSLYDSVWYETLFTVKNNCGIKHGVIDHEWLKNNSSVTGDIRTTTV